MKKYVLVTGLVLAAPAALAQDSVFDEGEQKVVSELTQVAELLQSLGSDATPEQMQESLKALADNVEGKAAVDAEQAKRPVGQVQLPVGALAFEGKRTTKPVQGASCQNLQMLVKQIDELYMKISEDTVNMAAALMNSDFAKFRSLLDSTKKRVTEASALNAKVQLSNPQKIQVQWPIFQVRLKELTPFRESAIYAQAGVVGDGKLQKLPRRALEDQGGGFWWTENEYIRSKPMSVYVDLWTVNDGQIIESPHGQMLQVGFEAPSAEVCFGPVSVVRSTTVSYTYSIDMFECGQRTCQENYNEMIALDAPAYFYTK